MILVSLQSLGTYFVASISYDGIYFETGVLAFAVTTKHAYRWWLVAALLRSDWAFAYSHCIHGRVIIVASKKAGVAVTCLLCELTDVKRRHRWLVASTSKRHSLGKLNIGELIEG